MAIEKKPYTPEEFDAELVRTRTFVEGVLTRLKWERYKDPGVVEAVELGLTRNQLEYGTRFCPCYGPLSYFKADGKKNLAAICPCPAAVRMDSTETGAYGPFATREELVEKTKDWPAPGDIEQREDGWYMVSHHPGIDHCMIFVKAGTGWNE